MQQTATEVATSACIHFLARATLGRVLHDDEYRTGRRVAVSDPSLSFGELVREHRRSAGLTQEELAERAGVSPRSISEMERGGAHVPRRDTVALLARALNLVGSERSEFEALVQRPHRPRPVSIPTRQPEHRHDERENTIKAIAHNLPRALTSFVGREVELGELRQALPNAALLTIVGVGGVGKTRLAQELLRAHAPSYADGGWLVELAGLSDGGLVPAAVAAALGLGNVQPSRMLATLADFLRDKQVLLVLDNCEHVVDACAELVIHLTRVCARLQVLATSREPLAIDGEITWRLQPLEVPDLRQPLSTEVIGRLDSVQLFLERARAVNQTLALHEQNVAALARICSALAGIPLALELAAARTRVLTLEQLAQRLDQDADFLESTTRNGLSRHRTLRTTIDWSHDLLGDKEQVLLRRLAVFPGSWTLRHAEEVCSGPDLERAEVLDLLAQLVDKSMVLVDTRQAIARYRFLEPIRQYALERLEASDDADEYRARHAMAFLTMAQACQAVDAGPDEVASLDRMEAEHDNLRAALRWAQTYGRTQELLLASTALFRFWERRGYFHEGSVWLEAALAGHDATGDTTCLSAGALCALAGLYWRSGDTASAQPVAERALVVSRESGHVGAEGWALGNLGAIAYFDDRSSAAVEWLELSVTVARRAGHLPLLSLALTYFGRALLSAEGPQSMRAAAALREALHHAEAIGSRYASGAALVALGDLEWRQDHIERAMSCWRRALMVRAEMADRRGIAGCLERMAWGLTARDKLAFAACVFSAAETQHRLLSIDLRPDERCDHLQHLTTVRRRLSEESYDRSWSAGRSCTLDQIVSQALDWTR
jgi:non-specific serine/threonine protein kinase